MRRFVGLSAIAVAAVGFGYVVFGSITPGSEPSDPIASAASALPSPEDANAEPAPVEGGIRWVAIDFDEQPGGPPTEYFGRASGMQIEALLEGRLEGYLRLDEVFWIFDDGETERLDHDVAFGASAHFRVDAIRRVTPLKDGFAEAARRLPPGDRIIPGRGA